MIIPSSQEMFNAVRNDNTRQIKLLIENGADVNMKVENGWTPLHYASSSGGFYSIKLLIENGADVNMKDKIGRTPLMVALTYRDYEIAEILIENGANVNDRDNEGKTILDFVDIEKITPEFANLLKYGNYSDYCKSVIEKGHYTCQEAHVD